MKSLNHHAMPLEELALAWQLGLMLFFSLFSTAMVPLSACTSRKLEQHQSNGHVTLVLAGQYFILLIVPSRSFSSGHYCCMFWCGMFVLFGPYIMKTCIFRDFLSCKNCKFECKQNIFFFQYFCSIHRMSVHDRTASPRRF